VCRLKKATKAYNENREKREKYMKMLKFDTDCLPIKILKPRYIPGLENGLHVDYLERLEQFKAFKRLERKKN